MKNIFGLDLSPITTNSKKAHQLERVLERLTDHPVVQKILQEDEAAALAARLAIGEKIKAALALSAERRAGLQAAFDTANHEMKRLEPAYEAAASKWRAARDQLHLFELDSRGETERLMAQLEQSPAPLIDEAAERLHAMHWHLVQEQPTGAEGKSDIRGKVVRVWRSDRPSRVARMRAILDARNAVLDMKLTADHSDLRERIKALFDGLPPIEVSETVIR